MTNYYWSLLFTWMDKTLSLGMWEQGREGKQKISHTKKKKYLVYIIKNSRKVHIHKTKIGFSE